MAAPAVALLNPVTTRTVASAWLGPLEVGLEARAGLTALADWAARAWELLLE
jgi:hypothetical protein